MQFTVPKSLLSATAVAVIGMGIFFVVLRPPLMIEDIRFMASSEQALHLAAPRFADWLTLVFRVMGGFMIATGSLLLALLSGDALRPFATKVAVAVAGIRSIGVMTVVNFAIGSDFKWMILAFAALWAAAVIGLVNEKSP